MELPAGPRSPVSESNLRERVDRLRLLYLNPSCFSRDDEQYLLVNVSHAPWPDVKSFLGHLVVTRDVGYGLVEASEGILCLVKGAESARWLFSIGPCRILARLAVTFRVCHLLEMC